MIISRNTGAIIIILKIVFLVRTNTNLFNISLFINIGD